MSERPLKTIDESVIAAAGGALASEVNLTVINAAVSAAEGYKNQANAAAASANVSASQASVNATNSSQAVGQAIAAADQAMTYRDQAEQLSAEASQAVADATDLVRSAYEIVEGPLSDLDATPGLVEQISGGLFTKRAIGVGSASSIPTRADADARYVTSSAIEDVEESVSELSGQVSQLSLDVGDVESALAGKANSSHTHAISDVTGLQTALDGKAASSHTHAISDVTGLQTALDGKAASSHTHAISDVTGLQTALDGKAATSVTDSLDSRVDALELASGDSPSSTFDPLVSIGTLLKQSRIGISGGVDQFSYGFADSLSGTSFINTGGSTGAYFSSGYAQNRSINGDATHPTVVSTAGVSTSSATTSHSITGLTGAENGREVIVFIAQDSGSVSSATIGGQSMSSLTSQLNSNVRLTVMRRNLTGAESNLNITITTSTGTTLAAHAYVISGMRGAPEVATGTTPASPPSLTPSWGSGNTLWFSICAHEADRNFTAPTNYTNAVVTRANTTGDFSGTQCTVASSRRASTASSEQPTAWGIQGSTSGNQVLATVAIRAAEAAPEDMDLRWNAYEVSDVPESISLMFEAQAISGTISINTNMKAFVSRDGGTTFTETTLVQRSSSSGLFVFQALDVDVTGQPSGNDIVVRITTENDGVYRINDLAVMTEAALAVAPQRPSGALRYIGRWSYSGPATSVVFNDLEDCNYLVLIFQGLTPSASDVTQLDFSSDGGSTWPSGGPFTEGATSSSALNRRHEITDLGAGLRTRAFFDLNSNQFPFAETAVAKRNAIRIRWALGSGFNAGSITLLGC